MCSNHCLWVQPLWRVIQIVQTLLPCDPSHGTLHKEEGPRMLAVGLFQIVKSWEQTKVH